MKIKRKSFEQFLMHDIEELEAEIQEGYLEQAFPLIGQIVMFFNTLEKDLDHMIYESFSDRSDQMGIIVISGMNYSAKVDLFKRYSDIFHWGFQKKIPDFELLIKDLRECGRLRNLTVHADWNNTDIEGYTYLGTKITKDGINQEYIQFSIESLKSILELIHHTRFKLSDYYETRSEILSN
ncbi:hypothetical protein J8Z86_03720 [Yersinia enterocolitica]|uniref:hypothetical protein n=1 Tax=Yersinia enterocolitica TaxID=630 RepID=UPI001C8D83A0|nr:hypothetical protein [Yersinia enterocolitica]MBX9495194.1 hypothetical protein [Yersinia enterocolitica]